MFRTRCGLFVRKSDNMERKAKNRHPSDCPEENESYCQRQDMRRASHIDRSERQSVRKTATHRKAQASKDNTNAEWRVNIRNQINALPEETRSTLFNRSASIYPEMQKVQSEGKAGPKFSGQIAVTKPSGQIAVTKTAGQIAVTKNVGQIRKLKLLKEEHPTKRQKVHMKHDRLLEILKDSEKEKNEKKYYVIKHQEKMKQNKKFVASTVSIKKCIKQLKIEKVQSEGKTGTKTASQIRELMLHKEEHLPEWQKVQISFNNCGTRRPSDSRNKLNKHFVPNETLAFPSSEGDEVKIESWDKVQCCNITPTGRTSMIQKSNIVYNNPLTPAVSSHVSTPNKMHLWITANKIYMLLFSVKYEAASIRSEYDSTFMRLYRNIIRNETCRMMMNIDIVLYEAKHLFGVVRTQIFFDLLDNELSHFGSSQAISNFQPNMVESDVRQHVISFFEDACDMMNRLMTLLLGCPDGKILQQMPEPTFISLLQSVIDSFLSNNKTKRGQSDKGTQIIRLIMVAPGLFVVAVGEEIPEDILVRFRHGDETVMNRFVDAGLEIMQASQMQDSRPSCTPHLPDNAKLFIYIPTENGSYWHKMDMLRDNRIRCHGK